MLGTSDKNTMLRQCSLDVTSDVSSAGVPELWMRPWLVCLCVRGKDLDVAPQGCVRVILHIHTPLAHHMVHAWMLRERTTQQGQNLRGSKSVRAAGRILNETAQKHLHKCIVIRNSDLGPQTEPSRYSCILGCVESTQQQCH